MIRNPPIQFHQIVPASPNSTDPVRAPPQKKSKWATCSLRPTYDGTWNAHITYISYTFKILQADFPRFSNAKSLKDVTSHFPSGKLSIAVENHNVYVNPPEVEHFQKCFVGLLEAIYHFPIFSPWKSDIFHHFPIFQEQPTHGSMAAWPPSPSCFLLNSSRDLRRASRLALRSARAAWARFSTHPWASCRFIGLVQGKIVQETMLFPLNIWGFQGFLQIFPSPILHDLGVCESYRYNPLQSYHQDHQDNPIGIIPLVNILLVDLAGASPAGSRRGWGKDL